MELENSSIKNSSEIYNSCKKGDSFPILNNNLKHVQGIIHNFYDTEEIFLSIFKNLNKHDRKNTDCLTNSKYYKITVK